MVAIWLDPFIDWFQRFGFQPTDTSLAIFSPFYEMSIFKDIQMSCDPRLGNLEVIDHFADSEVSIG
ncbi:MAG: hypothetical protein AAFY56_11050 [Pseudomonadota bacterium]